MNMTKKWIVLLAVLLVLLAALTIQRNTSVPQKTDSTVLTEQTQPTPAATQPSAQMETEDNNTEETKAPTISVEDGETQAPQQTTPAESTEETTEPEFNPVPTEDTRPPIIIEIPDETHPETDYETYNNMSEEEQKAFFDSFPDADAFFEWYNKAKEEYENSRTDVTIDGSTNIELRP